MTNEDAVDSAKEDLKRAKEKQTELSDQLTSALDAAGNDGATELVEMVSVFIQCMYMYMYIIPYFRFVPKLANTLHLLRREKSPSKKQRKCMRLSFRKEKRNKKAKRLLH